MIKMGNPMNPPSSNEPGGTGVGAEGGGVLDCLPLSFVCGHSLGGGRGEDIK
jgi:hypothetical protein